MPGSLHFTAYNFFLVCATCLEMPWDESDRFKIWWWDNFVFQVSLIDVLSHCLILNLKVSNTFSSPFFLPYIYIYISKHYETYFPYVVLPFVAHQFSLGITPRKSTNLRQDFYISGALQPMFEQRDSNFFGWKLKVDAVFQGSPSFFFCKKNKFWN